MIAHFIVAGKHCDAPLSMFEPHVTFAPLHLFFHLPTVWGRGTEDRSPPLDLIVFGPLRPCCAPTARCGLLLFNIYTAPGVNLQNKMGKTVHYCFFSSFFFLGKHAHQHRFSVLRVQKEDENLSSSWWTGWHHISRGCSHRRYNDKTNWKIINIQNTHTKS